MKRLRYSSGAVYLPLSFSLWQRVGHARHLQRVKNWIRWKNQSNKNQGPIPENR
jgi:hypothetical protein